MWREPEEKRKNSTAVHHLEGIDIVNSPASVHH
jgi:hypothetical protein